MLQTIIIKFRERELSHFLMMEACRQFFFLFSLLVIHHKCGTQWQHTQQPNALHQGWKSCDVCCPWGRSCLYLLVLPLEQWTDSHQCICCPVLQLLLMWPLKVEIVHSVIVSSDGHSSYFMWVSWSGMDSSAACLVVVTEPSLQIETSFLLSSQALYTQFPSSLTIKLTQ